MLSTPAGLGLNPNAQTLTLNKEGLDALSPSRFRSLGFRVRV